MTDTIEQQKIQALLRSHLRVTPLPIATNSSAISQPENSGLILPLTANEQVSWSIVGGADSAQFSVISGLILAAKDFEAPTDANGDNIYVVTVRATDALGNTADQTINVTITNVVDDAAPVITSSSAISQSENGALAFVLTANEPVTWSIIGGADAAQFSITGGSTLNLTAKDFEVPVDADANNTYVVTVRAVAGPLFADQTITVTITDVVETAPAPQAPLLSLASAPNDNTPNFFIDIPFGNGAPDDAIAGDVLQIDDITTATNYVTHTLLSGEITGTAIAITGSSARADGTHSFQARLVRSGTPSPWSNTVSVLIDSVAPTITTSASPNVDENLQLALALTASETVTWSLTGGADVSKVEISGTTLRWLGNGTKDFEAPNDANTDNVYVVQVTATDTAGNATNKTISITVNNVADSGFVFVPGNTLTLGSGGFFTAQTFSAIGIGTASTDRVVMAFISSGSPVDGTLSVVDGSNTYPLTTVAGASDGNSKAFYGSVPTGVNVDFVYSGNSIGMANIFLSYATIHGQAAGAAAAPTHSGKISVFQADPISLAITVDAGGAAILVGRSGSNASGTRTWTGAASSAGDGYAENPNGNEAQITNNHATASATVTLSGSQPFTGGSINYLAFAS